ncbi:MAG: ATP-dependent Clp protease ATP-binding subunit ClpX [Lachnospiraceae bacterium]|jgi:ATP-dependent Clp protease ATP-binding subunit ClpX|nr:ATP-dependent Clp protease ATP-binding subunit ClpX [Lachnospiraceae bacterium]
MADDKEFDNNNETYDNTPANTDGSSIENKTTNGGDNITEINESEYEDVCYICHRPERTAGKMIHMPNNICICNDCMQKTFDNLSNFDFGDNFSFGFPGQTITKEDQNKKNEQEADSENSTSNDDMHNLNNVDFSRFPNFGMINLSDLSDMFPNSQKIKKKKAETKPENDVKPVFSIHDIPHPHQIRSKLDEYVIGQDQAKKIMSVAVYNHYKRVATNTMDDIEIEKSNILMLGPTGSGKTYMVRTLAKLLDVPLAIADATSLTEAGYIGDDIESVVSKLLAAAGNDIEKAETGIIFIDEIDKLAKKKNTNQRDVSGESVQQGMLKLLEGTEIEVPVGASSKNAMVPMAMVNTRNILFICGGAFPDLQDIIKERLNKSSSMGFASDLKDKFDEDKNILTKVTVEDLRTFGMIPEFIGRLPVISVLNPLDEEMLVRILKEPKNAILKQYQKLLALDEVNLKFTDGALHAIAKEAQKRELGARALRAIIEEFMLDIMYEVPKDDEIGTVTITEDYVEKKGGPVIEMRTADKALPKPQKVAEGNA